MAHCIICNRDFASGASLRTHRSTFHRVEQATQSDNQHTESETARTNSDIKIENPETETRRTILDAAEKTMKRKNSNTEKTRKRKNSDTDKIKKRRSLDRPYRFNPYPPKSEDRYKDISVKFCNMLRYLSQTCGKKTYSFTQCYVLKHHMFDKLIPYIFRDERSMKDKMDEKDFTFALIARDLPNLVEVRLVLNDDEYAETIVRITSLFLREAKKIKLTV